MTLRTTSAAPFKMSTELDVEHLSSVSWAVVDVPRRVAADAVELVGALSWSEEGKTVEVKQLADTGLVVITGYSDAAVNEAVKLLANISDRDGSEVARSIGVRDPEAALEAAQALFENEFGFGSVFATADTQSNSVVVRGDPEAVGQVVQFLRTQGSGQDWISVRAVVVETAVGSAVDRGLSLSWTSGSSSASARIGGSNPAAIKGGFRARIGNDLNATIAWLNTDAQTRIVSKPSLSVRSGATAELNVGSQVPVLDAQINSTDSGDVVTQSVTYRDTGVSLSVAPKILSDGRISVVVAQEYSNAVKNVYSTVDSPVFNQRRLSTEIAVLPGELAVIAGLEGAEFAKNHSGPKLFRGLGSHKSSDTRLAIFLTATVQDGDTRSQAASTLLTATVARSETANRRGRDRNMNGCERGENTPPDCFRGRSILNLLIRGGGGEEKGRCPLPDQKMNLKCVFDETSKATCQNQFSALSFPRPQLAGACPCEDVAIFTRPVSR